VLGREGRGRLRGSRRVQNRMGPRPPLRDGAGLGWFSERTCRAAMLAVADHGTILIRPRARRLVGRSASPRPGASRRCVRRGTRPPIGHAAGSNRSADPSRALPGRWPAIRSKSELFATPASCTRTAENSQRDCTGRRAGPRRPPLDRRVQSMVPDEVSRRVHDAGRGEQLALGPMCRAIGRKSSRRSRFDSSSRVTNRGSSSLSELDLLDAPGSTG